MKTIIELMKEAGWGTGESHDDCKACSKFDPDEFAALVRAEQEWVDLTDDEIEDAVGYSINKAGLSACRRVISAFKAKQGESNV